MSQDISQDTVDITNQYMDGQDILILFNLKAQSEMSIKKYNYFQKWIMRYIGKKIKVSIMMRCSSPSG